MATRARDMGRVLSDRANVQFFKYNCYSVFVSVQLLQCNCYTVPRAVMLEHDSLYTFAKGFIGHKIHTLSHFLAT